MSANQKTIELSAELADELRKRFATAYTSIKESFDSSGTPTIDLSDGSEATTEDAVFIRTAPRSWALTKDVLGLAQTVYTPSVIQIVTEAGTGGNASCFAAYVSKAHVLALLETVGARGTRVEYWETANGTIPNTVTPAADPTQLSGATLIASFEASLYFPLQSSQ